MPPRKTFVRTPSTNMTSGRQASSRNKLQSRTPSQVNKQVEEDTPQEIDINAVISEYLAESNAVIMQALQARQEQLLAHITQLDASISTGHHPKK